MLTIKIKDGRKASSTKSIFKIKKLESWWKEIINLKTISVELFRSLIKDILKNYPEKVQGLKLIIFVHAPEHIQQINFLNYQRV